MGIQNGKSHCPKLCRVLYLCKVFLKMMAFPWINGLYSIQRSNGPLKLVDFILPYSHSQSNKEHIQCTDYKQLNVHSFPYPTCFIKECTALQIGIFVVAIQNSKKVQLLIEPTEDAHLTKLPFEHTNTCTSG